MYSQRNDWIQRGIINDRFEFVQWVHLWRMNETAAGPIGIYEWFCMPWHRPCGQTELDYEAIKAALYISKGDGWPVPWVSLRLFFCDTIVLESTTSAPWYWQLRNTPSQHHLMGDLTRLFSKARKQRIECVEYSHVSLRDGYARKHLVEAEQFRVIKPSGGK